MMGSACVFTNGKLDHGDAKTAHGLIRGTERFDIIAVIDTKHAGRDAGEVLDGRHRGIPVYPSVAALVETTRKTPAYGIIGVALSGGRLDEDWQRLVLEAIRCGISIVNGMHMLIGDIPSFREASRAHGVEILDIRRPKPFDQLQVWNGRIYSVSTPRLAVLGTDCALGKRTTGRMLMNHCRRKGIATEMVYTGQTGWLQGHPHGFILDATLNDFVSGEIERAIVECARESSPDLILVEGQSALRNPLGPCGSEIIISGNVKGVIMQHAPFRKFYDVLDNLGCLLPDVQEEIQLAEMYGTRVLAVTLNGEGGSPADLATYSRQLQDRIGLPVVRPLEEGVERLLPIIRQFLHDHDRLPDTTRLKSAVKRRHKSNP